MTKKHLKKTIINRKICICKNKLGPKINFGYLPLINTYSRKKNSKKYPVIVTQCKKCLLIQLKYSIADKLLFSKNYSYLSGNSKEKLGNFKSILEKIKKYSKTKNPKILDIGSNDGSFLELVKRSYKNVATESINYSKKQLYL